MQANYAAFATARNIAATSLYIQYSFDEVLFGVRIAIAVKIFGHDLAELQKIVVEIEKAMPLVKKLVNPDSRNYLAAVLIMGDEAQLYRIL